LFSEYLEKWLEDFLDMGLTEWQFWDMTLAELNRYAESFKRQQKRKAEEKAIADYRLADLIGYSMARLYSNSAKYPEIYDVYPAIFDKAAIEEARTKEKSKKTNDWLMNFADSFNKSNSKEGKDTR
jgi:hypothetical protein